MLARSRGFWRNADGNIAVMFGFLAVPLVGLAGLALDYTRASSIRSEMQNAADSAALAAATQLPDGSTTTTATNYFAAQTAGLALKGPATVTVSNPGQYSVKVQATAQVRTTLLAVLQQQIDVAVSATAERGAPSKVIDLKIDKFNSDAYDANTIAWYVVPKGGDEPANNDLTPILSNDPKNPIENAPKKITIGAEDTIGFALINVTGGVTPYGPNGYGQAQGSMHRYYSHLEPENVRINGAADCVDGSIKQSWDDNGGTKDDNDYNDAVFRYSCEIEYSAPTDVRLVE